MLRRVVDLTARIQQHSRQQTTSHSDGKIRVVCVADTHSNELPIPPGDVLIHAGDLTKSGKLSELQQAITWLRAQPHPHKIVIAGNADLCLDPTVSPPCALKVPWEGITYLCGSAATLKLAAAGRGRQLRVFGDPCVPRCGPEGEEAFQYEVGEDYWHGSIPPNTDVLVTHTPPRHILDEWDPPAPEGCPSLCREVERVRPALHVFGHVHPAYGQEHVIWENLPLESHVLRRAVHERQGESFAVPALMRIFAALFISVLYAVKSVFGVNRPSHGTTFVNAAAMSRDGSRLQNAPVVIDM